MNWKNTKSFIQNILSSSISKILTSVFSKIATSLIVFESGKLYGQEKEKNKREKIISKINETTLKKQVKEEKHIQEIEKNVIINSHKDNNSLPKHIELDL